MFLGLLNWNLLELRSNTFSCLFRVNYYLCLLFCSFFAPPKKVRKKRGLFRGIFQQAENRTQNSASFALANSWISELLSTYSTEKGCTSLNYFEELSSSILTKGKLLLWYVSEHLNPILLKRVTLRFAHFQATGTRSRIRWLFHFYTDKREKYFDD